MSRFFRLRTIWWPTWPVWLAFLMLVVTPALLWAWRGEAWFSRTDQSPAEILIVEGWIGIEGVRAAQAEFERGSYRAIVTTGALTENRWGAQRWNYAVEAGKLLRNGGVDRDLVIEAPAPETDSQRTFASALAVRETLAARGMTITSAHVFTRGVHARRSRLIFAKALGPDVDVGSIAWRPAAYGDAPWWQSTERSEDLLKETVGYLYELLLNSGRGRS